MTSLALATVLAGACQKSQAPAPGAGVVPIEQGWNTDIRTKWYTYSQGSRLLPLVWARALELAGSTELFLDPAHIARLGYAPFPGGGKDSLPIGFALDATPDARLSNTALHWMTRQDAPSATPEPWVGLNCSACHTAQITYQGKVMTVDGGPAMSDFQQLLADLRDSLAATLADQAKFDRFAGRVLQGADNTPQNKTRLAAALRQLSDHEQALGRINATDLKYGFGRLDAFGHIYSKTAFLAAGEDAIAQPSDAPTSYPFLWGIAHQDLIQYNGIAKNAPISGVNTFDPGALARNTGEVVGVFADVKLSNQPTKGYTSSVQVDNLVWFEQQLEALRAPAWPGEAVFGDKGKLDPQLVAEGRQLFGTDNTNPNLTTCATCHQVVPPQAQTTTSVKVRMSHFWDADPPGTDPWMACNAFVRTAPSGVLKGTPKSLFSGAPLGDEPFISDLLTTTVSGILLDRKGKVAAVAAASLFGLNRPVAPPQISAAPGGTLKDQQLQTCMSSKSPILAYKGRPLNGIWATPPYVHNGSVPTLAELLNPAKRSATFWVGSREYDPVQVGYVSQDGVGSKFDTTLPGNSNKGHDYGTSALSDQQRRALIEYMKTL